MEAATGIAGEFAARCSPALESIKKLLRAETGERVKIADERYRDEMADIRYSEGTWKQIRNIKIGGDRCAREPGVGAEKGKSRQGDPVGFSYLCSMEAAGGFEPPYNGFADRRLTTWLSRPEELIIYEPVF